MNYSIREVCEQFHLTAHTLRYYEKIGLLTQIRRTNGGIRSYSDEDLESLNLICCLKNTGMPLTDIAKFISLTQQGDHTLRQRCEILESHKQHVMYKVAEMETYLEKISWKIGYFSGLLEAYERQSEAKAPLDLSDDHK